MYCINSIKLAITKLIILLDHLPRQYLKRRNGIITQSCFLINVDNAMQYGIETRTNIHF